MNVKCNFITISEFNLLLFSIFDFLVSVFIFFFFFHYFAFLFVGEPFLPHMYFFHVFFLKFPELLLYHILMLTFIHKIFNCFLRSCKFLHHLSVPSSPLSFVTFLPKFQIFPLVSPSLFKILEHSIHWIISTFEPLILILLMLFKFGNHIELLGGLLFVVVFELLQAPLVLVVEGLHH